MTCILHDSCVSRRRAADAAVVVDFFFFFLCSYLVLGGENDVYAHVDAHVDASRKTFVLF